MTKMKGITCCGDCGYYNWKKHKCTRATDEGDARDKFYADCPLPDVIPVQEPRVMSLEEVDALGDDAIVWLECLYTFDGENTATLKPAIYQSDNSSPEEDGYYCVVSSWGKSGFYHKDNYMGDWRCWTSSPTDEQRREVKWQ